MHFGLALRHFAKRYQTRVELALTTDELSQEAAASASLFSGKTIISICKFLIYPTSNMIFRYSLMLN
jgi:hypothetical protein